MGVGCGVGDSVVCGIDWQPTSMRVAVRRAIRAKGFVFCILMRYLGAQLKRADPGGLNPHFRMALNAGRGGCRRSGGCSCQ